MSTKKEKILSKTWYRTRTKTIISARLTRLSHKAVCYYGTSTYSIFNSDSQVRSMFNFILYSFRFNIRETTE